jgi:hypothetical protein
MAREKSVETERTDPQESSIGFSPAGDRRIEEKTCARFVTLSVNFETPL